MQSMPRQDHWTDVRVAVTGASGFVGHHLVVHLRRANAQVTALVRATSNTERLQALGCSLQIASLDDKTSLLRAMQCCDVVFHVAAAVDFGQDLERLRNINVRGTENVIAAARQAGVQRLIHTSSMIAVACSDRPVLLDEQSCWNLGHLRMPYITTKREAEELALASNDSDLEVVVCNPGCVLGPEDYSRSEFGTLCRRFWKGQVPFYFSGGSNFVDVRDVVDGMMRLAQRGRAGQRYLLTGHNLTYAEFFTALAEASGRRYLRMPLPGWSAPLLAGLLALAPKRSTSRPLLSRQTAQLMGKYLYFDSAKARKEIGWQPRPLSETLLHTHAFWMPRRAA